MDYIIYMESSIFVYRAEQENPEKLLLEKIISEGQVIKCIPFFPTLKYVMGNITIIDSHSVPPHFCSLIFNLYLTFKFTYKDLSTYFCFINFQVINRSVKVDLNCLHHIIVLSIHMGFHF